MSKTAWSKDRWFVLGLAALAVNAGGWWWTARQQAPEVKVSRPPEFALGGDEGFARDLSTLRWTFPAPVVAPESTGNWVTNTVVEIRPPVEGAVRWAESNVLEFKPAAAWPKCQTFQARLLDRLAERTGKPVVLPNRPDEFIADPLRLVEATARPKEGDDNRLHIRLRFSAPPAKDSLLKHLRLERPDGGAISWSVLAGDGTPDLRLETEGWLSRDMDTVKLLVNAGLASTVGPAGLAKPAVVDLPRKSTFAFSGVDVSTPDGWEENPAVITLKFTRRPVEKGFLDFVKVDPPVEGLDAGFSSWSDTVSLRGRFQPGKSYRIEVRAGLAAPNGETLAKGSDRTVQVPERSPALRFRDEGRYLSRAGTRRLAVDTVNVPRLKVTARPVYENNLVHGVRQESSRTWWWDDEDAYDGLMGATRAKVFTLKSPVNEVTTHALDLGAILPADASGAWLIRVEQDKPRRAANDEDDEEDYDAPLQATKVVVFSDTGLLAKKHAEGLLVWANSLHTLGAATNAAIQVLSSANQPLGEGVTDAQGLARIALRSPQGEDEIPYLVVARQGNDLSFLNLTNTQVPFPDTTAGHPYHREGYEAFLYTDRGIYRPGETVHAKAVVRDAAFAAPKPFPVEFRVLRPDGGKLAPIPAMLNELGTAEIEVRMPAELPTGNYDLQLWLPGGTAEIGSVDYASEDFIPPQIAVELSGVPAQVRAGEPARVDVKVRHLFGGAGANLPVEARLHVKAANFAPAQWEGYSFGNSERSFSTLFGEAVEASTDETGAATLEMPTEANLKPAARLQGVVNVTVREASGRASTSTRMLWIDPVPHYVGLRPHAAGGAWPVGKPAKLDLAAVLPSGEAATEAGALEYKLFVVTWNTVYTRDGAVARYESRRDERRVADGTVKLAAGRGELALDLKTSGYHRLVVDDPKGGASTAIEFYASEYADASNAWAMDKPGRVDLKPDRETYRPGDTAVLRVQAPNGGKALVTVETDRVLHTAIQDLAGNTGEVRVPVTEAMSPNAYVTVQILRPVKAGDKPGLHRANGASRLVVDRPERRLTVAVQSPAEIRPQSRLETVVKVDGLNGQSAEVSLAAIEEGICLLTNLKTPDPLGWFARTRRLATEHLDLYSLLLPEISETLQAALAEAGGDGIGQLERRLNPIKTRRYKPTALWVGRALTDSNGVARIAVDVPEYTGALRLMAVAVAPGALGSGAGEVKVKRPLILQTGAPRFLAPGDEAQGNLWISNQSAAPMQVKWTVTASGPLAVPTNAGTVTVPAGGDTSVAILLQAARDAAGAATLRVQLAGGGESVTEEIELPVRPAVARETLLRSGRLESGASVEIASTAAWLPSTADGGIQAAGLPALRWKGAYEALMRYPYGCLEQTLSTSFPLLHAADLVEAMLPGRLTRAEAAEFAQAGIHRVLTMQRSGGGFGWWPGSDQDYAYGTVYAVEFLTEAKRAGFDVPADALARALDWTERMLDSGREREADTGTPGWHQTLREQAFACSQLARNGRARADWQARLWELRGKLDIPARVQLARAFAATGDKERAAELLGTSSPAPVAPAANAGFDRTLQSGAATAALHLRAWLEVDPASPAVPALAEALIRLQSGGRWATTHDNAQALLALGAYSRAVAGERKPFAAALAMDGKPALEFTDAKALAANWKTWGGAKATLTNRGPGTLYYHVREDGIPLKATEPEGDHGIAVRRSFRTLNNEPLNAAALRAGDWVVIRTEVDTQGVARDQLVVEALLPAGLEIENPSLATSAETPWIDTDAALPVAHRDIRDDRVVLFTGPVAGARVHHLLARAVTPGTFALPAVSVEAMYDPAVRSRHGAGTLKVTKAPAGGAQSARSGGR